MATSQNGWPALTSSADTRLRVLPHITGRVLAGPVWVVFDYLCRRFVATVEPITQAHSWGHAYRAVTNGRSLSNHASGTAVDLNAPRHPYGRKGTFTAAQVRAIRTILAELRGVVRWGGDYAVGDEMHFEIVGSAAQVASVASAIGGVTTVGGPIIIPPPVLPGDPGPVVPSPTPTPDPISPTPTPKPTPDPIKEIDMTARQFLLRDSGDGTSARPGGAIAEVDLDTGKFVVFKDTEEYTVVTDLARKSPVSAPLPGPVAIGARGWDVTRAWCARVREHLG